MYNVHCTCTDRSAQCKCIFIFCIFMCLLIFFFSISRSYSSSSSSSSICSSFCFLLHISWFGFWFQLVSLLRIIVHVQIFNIYKNVGNWIAVVTCLNFLVDFLGRFWWCTPLTAYDTHTHKPKCSHIWIYVARAQRNNTSLHSYKFDVISFLLYIDARACVCECVFHFF